MHCQKLGIQNYKDTWAAMKDFTLNRLASSEDEIWFLQHHPVFTQGQAGKAEHVLHTSTIPIVQSDRGGQITYHGPGQLVVYFLIDIKRRHLGIKTFVSQLETLLIQTLEHFKIKGSIRCGAPGVYVNNQKIASIGLRVKNGCTYHGISLNIDMDLKPFSYINPCGYNGLLMTQMSSHFSSIIYQDVEQYFLELCQQQF